MMDRSLERHTNVCSGYLYSTSGKHSTGGLISSMLLSFSLFSLSFLVFVLVFSSLLSLSVFSVIPFVSLSVLSVLSLSFSMLFLSRFFYHLFGVYRHG